MNAPDFATASKQVLTFLHERLGMDLWMITRTDDENWIVLSAEDHGYGIASGDIFRWADTLCIKMAAGAGPRVAPRVADIAAYASAPIARQLQIGAYVSVPLVNSQGQLFGTLCGLNPEPMSSSLLTEQGMIEVLADMLSGLLNAELQAHALAREAETTRSQEQTDTLTGLSNRRAWENALAAEEERCRRYGTPACVIMIELDGPPATTMRAEEQDEQRTRGATVLRQCVRKPDTLARLDRGVFAILGVECNTGEALALLRRLEQSLQQAQISAALGMAIRSRSAGLTETSARAHDAMEEHLHARANDRAGTTHNPVDETKPATGR